MPAPNRFPSAADGKGFKPLADYVHRKGLKFGIHIMRGIPRRAVEQNLPVVGTQGEGRRHRRQAVDLPLEHRHVRRRYDASRAGRTTTIRSSSCTPRGASTSSRPTTCSAGQAATTAARSRRCSKAIRKSGRPIVLSLSPGTRDAAKARVHRTERANVAHLGRFLGSLGGSEAQFPNFAKWSPYVKPGNWPDADMLPLGHIGIRAERGDPRMSLLTHDEQRTLMTLWSIARSPLMFGGHLPDNDEFTLALITNDEVLAVNQKATASKELFTRGNQVAWIAEVPGAGEVPGGVQHRRYRRGSRSVNWADLGLPANCTVRDLWARKDVGRSPAATHSRWRRTRPRSTRSRRPKRSNGEPNAKNIATTISSDGARGGGAVHPGPYRGYAGARPLHNLVSAAGGQMEEALAIGNGRLGAMIFGGIEKERLQLNEISIWSGRLELEADRPEAYKGLPGIRQRSRMASTRKQIRR